MSLVRIVAHDIAHVHLDIKLFKVNGEHHQRLPWRTLLCCCFSIAERRGGGLGNRVCRNTQTHITGFYMQAPEQHIINRAPAACTCVPLRGAEESDTLRERPMAGDLRCAWLGVASVKTEEEGY